MQTVYFDNNATTMVAPEVTEAMLPFFGQFYGNPSSMHRFGGEIMGKVDEARGKIAQFLNAEPDEIIFTGCGTESDNAALNGFAELHGPQNITIITSKVEHPAIITPCRNLKKKGATIIEIPVNSKGELDMAAYAAALEAPGKKIVSIMWANNETGVVFPIRQIAQMAKTAGAVMHTDAVQAAGKTQIDLNDVPVDLLSISGHKLHAPKGIGVCYMRRGTNLPPFIAGGHQESGRRAGTENVPYIVGLAKACELAGATMQQDIERERALRDKLEQGLLAACPDARINGAGAERLSNTTNISFEYVEGEAIIYMMSDAGICASTGSACASGSLEPSHVIRAMAVPFTALHGSVRFSLSRYTTEREVDYVLAKMPEIIRELRALSPFGKGDKLPVEL